MLITHIIIALTSLIVSTSLLFRPSAKMFTVSYGFMAATLGTGTLLVVLDGSYLIHACVSGITYLAVTTALTVFAHRKFATVNA